MKSVMIMGIVSVLAGAYAHADGFVCEGAQYNTKYRIYNETKPSKGTRNVAKIIVSDQSVSDGRKTIATFDGQSGNGLARQNGTTYTANVDSRYKTARRGGENIAGTKLSELKTITVDVYFSYYASTPSRDGDRYSALVTYTKENGKQYSERATCARYLKKKSIKRN